MKKHFFISLFTILFLSNCGIFQSNTAPVLSKIQSKFELYEIHFSDRIENVKNSNKKIMIEIKSFTINTLPSTFADSVFFFENTAKTQAYKVIRIIDEKSSSKNSTAVLELSNKKYLKVEKGQYNDFITSDMLDKYDGEMGKVRYYYNLVKP